MSTNTDPAVAYGNTVVYASGAGYATGTPTFAGAVLTSTPPVSSGTYFTVPNGAVASTGTVSFNYPAFAMDPAMDTWGNSLQRAVAKVTLPDNAPEFRLLPGWNAAVVAHAHALYQQLHPTGDFESLPGAAQVEWYELSEALLIGAMRTMLRVKHDLE